MGRNVLVTGASAGIGRAAALAFAREGATVFAAARSRERLDELAQAAGARPGKIVPIVADVADPVSMEALAERVGREIGAPDVIVANAGIGLDARFVATPDAAFHSVFETNVLGVVRTIRPFVEAMVRRGSGRILIVSSVVGKRGIPHYAAYSASKFALDGLADALRAELYGTGVTVGVLYPSSTTTEFHDRLLRHGPQQRRIRPRRHSAESVARAIVRMAASRRREAVLSFEGKLLVAVDWIAPGLLDRVLARVLTRDDKDQDREEPSPSR